VTTLVCQTEFFDSEDFLEIDSEDQHELQAAYRQTCTDAVAETGGTIVEFTSDGMTACFGFPIAHEDSVQRAVRSGLGLQAALAELSTQQKQELAPQIAAHSGSVVAEQKGDPEASLSLSIVGTGRSVAARPSDIAEPGSFVISADSQEIVRGFFNCESHGTHKVRGVSEPVEVFLVTGESEARHRLDLIAPKDLTPLIGRNTELSILRDRWEHAAEGMGQVVLLIGEGRSGQVATDPRNPRARPTDRSRRGTHRAAMLIAAPEQRALSRSGFLRAATRIPA